MFNNTLPYVYIATNKERKGRIVAGGNLIPIQRLLSLYLDIYIKIDLKYKTDNKNTGNNINWEKIKTKNADDLKENPPLKHGRLGVFPDIMVPVRRRLSR